MKNMSSTSISVTAIVPAAGVGKRMQTNCPKQYLNLLGKTVLEQTVTKLLASPYVDNVVIALGENDEYFAETPLITHRNVTTVIGGKERVDSVLAGVKTCHHDQWVMVHDAARPCVQVAEINQLVESCLTNSCGGLLAAKVKDTMKRSNSAQQVTSTVDREQLWHALTPQMFKAGELQIAIETGLANGVVITDESSAIEAAGLPSMLIEASSENLKITQPEDLALAEFILMSQQNKQQERK